jgi:hypothetical protein
MPDIEALDGKIGSQAASTTNWLQWRPGQRAAIVMLVVAVGIAGLFFCWPWVVAAGLSSVVLGLLPCAAMCAAGLCMNRLGQKSACRKSDTPVSAQEPSDSRVNTISAEGHVPLPVDGGAKPKDQRSMLTAGELMSANNKSSKS